MAEMRDEDRQLNLPRREEEILKFWGDHKIFEKTLAQTKRGKRFVFYEGPPYANGLPGIHHLLARVFKDIIIRYRTMRGFSVPRRAGWDTHGLPVEIQVEKELGLKSKRDIEKFGIAEFNAKCRASVLRHKERWENFTKRIGYWLDLDDAYLTLNTDYIETLWWIVKEIWRKKLLYQDFKVLPWCPRCQTPLSSHELGFGYQTVRDRALFARFRVKSENPRWARAAILSWTTTPWTLPGNVALAVNPDAEYVCIPDPGVKRQWLILGQEPFRAMVDKSLFPAEYRSSLMLDDIDTFRGKDLVGLAYEPLFAVNELASPKAHRVYAADFVTMGEGTGVVHTAVMYGEDDYRLGTEVGLPKFHTVDETGHFIKEVGEGLGGLFVKDAKTEEVIIGSLKRRGLLFAEEQYEHEYPFCWRCDTPLLYYARQGWWIKMSALKGDLLRNNGTINWIPDTIKHGRFGEFLHDVRDWALSRERYWGTPLPVWKCRGCTHIEVIGSLDDLSSKAISSGNRYFAMRHGQSEVQLLGVADDSEQTFHLTPRGNREVARRVVQLRKQKFDLIVASPVLRTRETAESVAVALGAPMIVDERLREIHVGVFEGKPVSQYHRYYTSRLEKFTKRPPEGESLNDLKRRVMALMQDLEREHRGKRILLISHEYPIWILWGASQGLTNEEMVRAKEQRRPDFVATAEMITIPFRPLPRNDDGDVDLHRPYVDRVCLRCERCASEMQRISEVADVWFDSGAVPFAQAHYPFQYRSGLPYPADYICEGVDMTRGWFYTLLAVATALGKRAPYRNVISLGLVFDRNNQKMSKSRGNVVDPNAMVAKYGTDAIRWYFYTINAPGDPKRFDERDVLLRLRGTLSTLWNGFVFFDTYVDKIPNSKSQIPNLRNVLDRWVAAKLDELTTGVTERLDDYDVVGAARLLDHFVVEDFSNWYLRRSRRRFQRPGSAREKREAAVVAGSALLRLIELMAPFTPFLAEVIYRELKSKIGLTEESVHLRPWPKQKARSRNKEAGLLEDMAEVRRLAALALAQRAKAGIKVRQPLKSIKIRGLKSKDLGLLDVLKDEVNVKEITSDPKLDSDVLLDTALTQELHEEGVAREIVRNIQELRRDAGMKPRDSIRVQVSNVGELASLIGRWTSFIKHEAGAREVEIGGKGNVDVGREVALDGRRIRLGIRKARP